MDFQQYRAAIARSQSSRWTPRQKRLNALSRVLRRAQYEHIKVPFSQERQGDAFTGKRILLDDRRPAVQEPLALELVRDQCGLIFGEDHRPLVIARDDDDTTQWIAAFVRDTKFWLTLMDALWKGSVGSSVIVLRILGRQNERTEIREDTGEEAIVREPAGPGKYYFEVWAGEECRPVFDRAEPDVLESLDRRYFIGEDALAAQGYNVDALKLKWETKSKAWRAAAKRLLAGDEWAVRIVLMPNEEVWYDPIPRYAYERPDWKDAQWEKDEQRSFVHDIGQVPAEWVRPLPINADEFYPDGACLFEPVIDYQFRIDRTLSQTGRAFDYVGDPQLARERGAAAVGGSATFGAPLAMGGTSSDVVEIDAGGEAKFIEITGEGLAVAIDTYVRTLRDIARESGAMSRVTADSKSGASSEMSSAAMKMLNYAQLVLSGILRITVGETPGHRILALAMKLYQDFEVALPSLSKKIAPKADAVLEWQWPDYYEPHGQEKLFEVQAASAAKENEGISQETFVANLAPLFDVQNNANEIKNIDADRQAADDRALEQAIQNAAIASKSQLNITESEPK